MVAAKNRNIATQQYMSAITLLNKTQMSLTLKRLARQLVENHDDLENTVLIGLQPKGYIFAQRLCTELELIIGRKVHVGGLDITFHRDDFRRRSEPIKANKTIIDFVIEDKEVILVDDVLYTGRSVRAGLDAMLSFGRPRNVELCVLIDRRFSRHLPVQPNYTGRKVDSIASERVTVEWENVEGEDIVKLYTENNPS